MHDEHNGSIARLGAAIDQIKAQLSRVIVGQHDVIEQMLIALFGRGHCLLEGVPGLAKTLLVSTLARSLNLTFSRIQFTPDLMPADITGTDIIEENRSTGQRELRFLAGPIFSHVILADEINRTPPKTQAALLEAMQERQVTVGRIRHQMSDPFLVLATQNPIEQEGTYPLPEAQVDRFMLKLSVGYPTREEERLILDRMASTNHQLRANPVVQTRDILAARALVDAIYIDEKVKEYIIDLVVATRSPQTFKLDLGQFIQYGASPRATLYLTLAAKAQAFINGRGYVTPQDVKSIGTDVLRHRVIVSYEAEAEEMTSDTIVQKIFDGVPVP